MTSSEGHQARMDSDTPRGYGVRSDVRKKLEGQHQAHPDPTVRALIADAWDEGHRTNRRLGPDGCRCFAWNESECACGRYGTNVVTPNPYRSAP